MSRRFVASQVCFEVCCSNMLTNYMYSINHVNGCPKLFNAVMKCSMCEKDHMFAGKGCEICSP